MGRRRSALIVAGLAGLITVLLSAGAGAATRTKLDRGNELRFTLKGSELTLTIVDRPNVFKSPTIQSDLFGKRVWAGCGRSFRTVNRNTFVGSVVEWPRGAGSTSVRLDRDISRRAKWCLVESRGKFAGGDIAFVSFHKAEPGRRLASGRLRDGTAWRLVAWRGSELQPCLDLRVVDDGGTICFDEEAETEAGIQGIFIGPTCSGETFVMGAVARSAARVDVRMGDGTVVPAVLRPRPLGSHVRAQYFTALLSGPEDIAAVIAYDAAGRRIARDRGINGMGNADCGGPDAR